MPKNLPPSENVASQGSITPRGAHGNGNSHASGVDTAPVRLEGNLGTAGLVFTALAMNAPLGIMATWIPFIIGNGIGSATPLTFFILMIFVLLFAVGLLAMARHMDKPGAFYTFIAAGLGRIPGLGAGFLALLLYISFAASSYMVFGDIVNGLLKSWGWPVVPWYVYSLIVWLVVTFISMRNIDVSARVLTVTLGIEIAVVVIYDLSVFIQGGPEGRAVGLFDDLGIDSIGFAMLWGIVCLTGFESIQVFRQETRDPDKTIPRATYMIVVLLAVFYAIGTYAYLVGWGPSAAIGTATDPAQGFLTSLAEYSGVIVKDVAVAMLLMSYLAAFLALQNIGSRYTFSMARDGALPKKLSVVHPRWKSPARSALAVGLVIFTIVASTVLLRLNPVRAFGVVGGIGNWAIVTLFAVTAISVIVYFARKPDVKVGLWRGAIAPGIGAIGFIYILVQSTVNRDAVFGTFALGTVFIGVVVAVAVGGGLYACWLRAKKPAVYERIGDQNPEVLG